MKLVLISKEEDKELSPIFLPVTNFKLLAQSLKLVFRERDSSLNRFISLLEKNDKEKSGELACRLYNRRVNNKYKMREYFS